MMIEIEPGERLDSDEIRGARRPEKGFLIVGSRRDAAPSRDAVGQARSLAHRDSVPDGRAEHRGAVTRVDPAENALGGMETPQRRLSEDTEPVIEIPAAFGKRPTARERFERRAEEIARAAEVGVRAMMEDEAKLFPPLVEERLPQIGDERGLTRGDAGKQPRRENADPGVEQGAWAVDAEGRDAVPFGLKRRVVLRVPVFRDEERRGAPRFAVAPEEGGEVRRDRGVGVDEQEIPVREEGGRVAERPGRAENPRLREKNEIRKVRRLMAQVALDLIAQVMEINRYFADAGLVKSPEVRHREGDIQEGQQRLRDRFGDGTESNAAAGAKEDRPHRA